MINKYLIFRTDRIGDFLITAILIKSIKRNDPNSHIQIISSKKNYTYIKSFKMDEAVSIPSNLNYESLSGLSNEIKSKLIKVKPKTLGQAIRIDGVTPAAIIILLSHIKKLRYKVSA